MEKTFYVDNVLFKLQIYTKPCQYLMEWSYIV